MTQQNATKIYATHRQACMLVAYIDSDVNKDWTCKGQDKDFTHSYLLQVAAKPTIAIKQQQ